MTEAVERDTPLTLAVASGKGGTGKTTFATNLAAASDDPVVLADCDVEEPDAHLFLHPVWDERQSFSVPNPQFDLAKCKGCGLCRSACRYHAIVMMGKKPLLFPELCHSCGACIRACPHQAITEISRPAGWIETGWAGRIRFVQGRIAVGEAQSSPLIRSVRRRAVREALAARSGPRHGPLPMVLVDAPPGTSCPVVAAVRNVDALLLVTEPTPFGLHDLQLAVEMAQQLHLPFAVAINRAGMGDTRICEFCRRENIPVLASLPFDRRVARAYSCGELLVRALPECRPVFRELLAQLTALARDRLGADQRPERR